MRIKYATVRIPELLMQEVDPLIKGGKRGYTSRSDFAKNAVRHLIDEIKE